MGCTMGKKQKGEEGGKEPPYGTKEPQEAPGEGTKETGENAAPEKDGEVAHLDAKVDLDPLLETQTEENAGQPTKPSVSEDIDPNTGSQPVHSTAAQDTEARGAAPDEEEPIPYVDSNVESATTRTTITKVSTTGTPEDGVTAERVTVTKTTVIKTSHTVEKNEDKPEESSLEPDKHKPVDNEVIVTKTTVTKTFERTEGDDKPTEIITTKTIDTHVEDKPKDTPATGEPEEPQPCHTSPPVVEYAEKPENEPVEAESCSRPEPIVEYAEKPESESVEAEPSDTSPPVVESLEKPEAEPEAEPCYTKTTVVEIVEEKHEKPESEPVEAEPCVVSPPDVECLEETKPEAEPCYTKTTVVEIVEEKHEKPESEPVEAEPCDTSPPVVEAEPEAETSYTKTTVVEIVEEKPGTETRITTVDHEKDTPVDTGETAVPEEHASDAPDAPVVVSTGPEPIDLSSLPEGLAERLRAIDAAEAGDGVVRTTRTTVTTTRVVGGDGEVVGHTVTETEKKEVVQAGGEEQVVVESHTVTEEDISQPVAEDGGVDPAAQGAQSEDRFYNNKSFQKPDIDPSDSQQQDAALKIQTKYRQHHAKQEVQKKREEKAATTIQATYRGHTDRQKVKDIKEGEAAEEAAEEEKVEEPAEESKPEEEVDIDLADPDVQAAATKIQASFRGHKARQEVKELKEHAQPAEEAPATEEPKEEESTDKEVVDIDLNDPQVAAAATKIQAGVRGYMARKEVHKMKEEQGEAAPAEGQEAEGQEGEATDINLEDPEVIAAATKIQAAVRGHHARQEVQVMKDSLEEAVAESQEIPPAEKEEEVDVDLNDPAVNQAATKIQAGFRGYKARQEVQTLKDSKSPEGGAAEAPPEVTSEAPAAPEGNQPEAADEDKKEEVDIDLNDPEVAQAATKIQAAFKGHLVRKDMKDKDGKEETTGDAPAEGEVTENKEGDQGEV